jgi:phosphatidylglycerophosphate synthase
MSTEHLRSVNAPTRRVMSRGAAPQGAVAAVASTVAATAAAAALLDLSLGTNVLTVRAGLLAAGGGAFVLWLAARHLRAARFGAANAVTLTRGALALLLLAMIDAAAAGWWLVAVAVAAVALDGVDGAIARSRGDSSAFGARFDMETDALLILVLAALVWQQDKAGAWVLLAGLLRYAFVAAGYVWRRLAAPLPPSRRRQTVCVLQIVSLIGALAPPVTPPLSGVLALAGVVLLAWSFAVDVHNLARRARG